MTSLSCVEARSMVSDYIDGELPDHLARALEAHLQTCANCPPLYASLVQTLADLRAMEDAEGVEELARRVEAALESDG
jgi:anti-sigma factor RsiW